MSKVFFDTDLVEQGISPAPKAQAAGEQRVGEAQQSLLERRKRELPEQVGQTSDEIERLRLRQEELERRKQALVEQRRRIENYERGRRELLDKLGRSAVMVVREGEQAARMAALCSETGAQFQRLHKEIDAIAPEHWSEDEYDRELTQALAQIEAANNEYRRSMDRVNASAWHKNNEAGVASDPLLAKSGASAKFMPGGFVQWLTAGFAFSLPLLLLVVIALIIYLLKYG